MALTTLPPAPFRTPFLDSQGQVVEIWRRFFLNAGILINFILASQNLSGILRPALIEDSDQGESWPLPGQQGLTGAQGLPGSPGQDGQDATTDDVWALQAAVSGILGALLAVRSYQGIVTAGWGVPAIYGAGRLTGQSAAVASVATYTVGAADGSFVVSMNLLMTAFVAGTISGVVTYTDEGGNARNLTLTFSSVGGTLSTTPGAAGAFEGVPLHIRAKAATAITCTTTVTVFTGTYNVEGFITQVG